MHRTLEQARTKLRVLGVKQRVPLGNHVYAAAAALGAATSYLLPSRNRLGCRRDLLGAGGRRRVMSHPQMAAVVSCLLFYQPTGGTLCPGALKRRLEEAKLADLAAPPLSSCELEPKPKLDSSDSSHSDRES